MKIVTYLKSISIGLLISYSVAASAVTHEPIETGFSPEGSAHSLVLDVINSSKKNLFLCGFIFTDPSVAKAIVKAKKRGVNIQVVLDAKENKGKSSKKAIAIMTKSGIKVRLDEKYRIQHDKVIIVDDKTVETGSYNYTRPASNKNSENVVVIWNNQNLAHEYKNHLMTRWEAAK